MARAIRYVPPEAAVSPEATGVYRYTLPEIPVGYELTEFDESSFNRAYIYSASNDKLIIGITAGDESTVHSVDTEDASVTDIVINSFQGILAEKDGTVSLFLADTDHSVFLTVYATALSKAQVLEMARSIRYVEPQQ